MADDQGNSQVPGGNIDRSELPPEDSSVATDNPSVEAPDSHRHSEPIKDGLWRPFTLRPPTLLFFLCLTIGLIAIIEVLNHTSARNGALIFADSQGEFSTAQFFCYRYFPQLVVVFYGIGWAAVDLDVKRLEPYFQLSKPGGASASDSILLHYIFDFLPLAPVAAAKRGHWNVFAAGTALVLIFWVITPLQSSLLTREQVAQEIPTQFVPAAKLPSYRNQSKELDSTFFQSSFGATWLAEKIERFMTTEFIAIPFKPVDSSDDKVGRGNESWTAVTRVYQTHIDCVPANIIEGSWSNGSTYYNFTTDGCSYRFNPLANKNATRNLIYIGRGITPGVPTYLSEPDCTVKNIFLGVWSRPRLSSTGSTGFDVAGNFCHARYSYADADITVDATTLDITGSSFIGEPKPVTGEDEIVGIGIFERFLGGGIIDYSMLFSLHTYHALLWYEGLNLWYDPSRYIGYAIGLGNKTFDDLRDPDIFGGVMNRTHKLLFNCAVRALFLDEDQPQQVDGTRVVRGGGVVVVPVVAHLLAGFLSAVALCLASVFCLSYNRRNNLRSDPESLATTMSLVAQSPGVLSDFEGADNCPDIGGCIEERQYRLRGREGGHRLEVMESSDATPPHSSHESSTKPHDGRGISPWELSAGMGVGTTILSSGLLVLLVVLFWSSQQHSGLPTLSNHPFVVQLIFSFTPTAFAMLIEPLWAVVTRHLALYQPWIALKRGHSPSAASLGLKYTNLPPALIAPRALVGGHYILFLASTVVLASNGLAVALGGLFEKAPRQVSAAMTFELPLYPNIDTQIQANGESTPSSALAGTFAKGGGGSWLVALTNLSGTSLPPWTSQEFYFLPFEWNTTAGGVSDLMSANTWGFGANSTCELLAGDVYGQQSWLPPSDDPALNPAVALNVTIPMANGREVRCTNSLVEFKLKPAVTGRFAGEYLFGLGAADREDQEAEEFCNSFLVMGWNRGSVTVENGIHTIDAGTYENMTILCTQQISSAEFNVVVDNKGLVQKFKRLTSFSYDNSSLFNHSTTIASFKAQLGTFIRTDRDGKRDKGAIHSDKYPRITPHYFIEFMGFKDFYNPSKPLPSYEDAQLVFQGFYNWFVPILTGQNSQYIFRSTTIDGGRKTQVPGQIISVQDRVSMDRVLFYIAVVLLGFSTIASVVIFIVRPKRLLPRVPNSLAAEIGFIYPSEALKDTAGTAGMNSRMREEHLAELDHRYGFGEYIGQDGRRHSGVERMGRLPISIRSRRLVLGALLREAKEEGVGVEGVGVEGVENKDKSLR